VADWVTISSLATAGGTLVLAAATFASVRSANRSARASEQALLAGLRPLLVSSSLEDPPLKVSFQDGKWLRVEGGRVSAEATRDVVYVAASLRNIGSGVAILHGWRILPGPSVSAPDRHDLDTFHRLSRDLYIAPGDIGFWQGAFRDPQAADFEPVRASVLGHERMTLDVLYGDFEGGQRVVTRIGLVPRGDDGWLSATARHQNIDRPDPR
jgi:hypothetical protein